MAILEPCVVIEDIASFCKITENLTIIFGFYFFVKVDITMVQKGETDEMERSRVDFGRAFSTFMKVCCILERLDCPKGLHIAHWHFGFTPLNTIPLDLTLEDNRELANLGLVSLGAFQGRI